MNKIIFQEDFKDGKPCEHYCGLCTKSCTSWRFRVVPGKIGFDICDCQGKVWANFGTKKAALTAVEFAISVEKQTREICY